MPAPASSLIRAADALPVGRIHPGHHVHDVPVAVWDVLTTIADGRHRRGRRHELATILVVAVAAVLAGSATLSGIAGWASDLPIWARTRVGIGRRPPSLSTIRRVLMLVDADVLDAVSRAWLAAVADPPVVPACFRAVAVDGKTCRGAKRPDGTRVHLFSAVEHGSGIPLGQVLAESKGFEIAAFATVLDRIDLSGVVVTADALHTQKAHARYLHRHGGKYVFTVKRNQPTLHAQLGGLPWGQVPIGHHEQGKAHGRRESRTIAVTSVKAGIGFPHARLAARITRTRAKTGTGAVSTERVCVITNLGWAQITPAQLAALVRGYWAIENRVQYVRDITFDEDRSQVRTGNGPRVMAILRNVAVGLIRARDHVQNIAAATRALGRRTENVLSLLDHKRVTPVTGASTLN